MVAQAHHPGAIGLTRLRSLAGPTATSRLGDPDREEGGPKPHFRSPEIENFKLAQIQTRLVMMFPTLSRLETMSRTAVRD